MAVQTKFETYEDIELAPDIERLLKQRYYKPGENWRDLVQRVVDHVCQDDEEFKPIAFHYIYNRIWLPNSPTLFSSGTKNGGLAACFTVGPDKDTLEHHVDTLGDIAAVGKFGGGCGFTGTFIREEGAKVAGSTHGFAYGPNNWAVRVSDYLDMITQGGARRMALMYTMRSDHPDLDKFISLKQTDDERFAYNFNQSVMATDSWMMNAANGKNSPEKEQLMRLARNAWNNGDPGLLFHTTINENTPYKTCGCPSIEVTNPCGEQPMPPYATCVLGSINVSHEIFFDDDGTYNYGELSRAAIALTRFLDNVGSVNRFPNEKFEQWYEDHRPIGVGMMGFADACLEQKMEYGKQASLSFLGALLGVISSAALSESERLGEERGVPHHCGRVGRRNITTTTIAPTGSIGFLAGCSHGIEPIFSPIYKRTDERGEEYTFEHPLRDRPYFVSAIGENTPSWKEHIDVQAMAQAFIDSATSKTINMPYEATVDDVYKAMVYAWQKGCKGITIYRDGSRQFQVLEDVKEEDLSVLDCPDGICEV